MTITPHASSRPDYPRPQFSRSSWLSLNGEWDFEFDDEQVGDAGKWSRGNHTFGRKILVPFSFESKLSGIGEPEFHNIVWYKRKLDVPAKGTDSRILLHFGAVDYEATVWVNGSQVAYHEGGHTPFCADITDVLETDNNVLVVKAVDYGEDVYLPRGKQFWKEKSAGIWYTRTTGIWQSVWLETVHNVHLEKVKYLPDIDHNEINIRSFVHGLEHLNPSSNVELAIAISFQGEPVSTSRYQILTGEESRTIRLTGLNDHGMDRFWSPEHPNLYDVEYTLLVGGHVVDEVKSYFGMRKISIESGRFNLNNRPYFMRLVLDQGYFPDGNLTPPSDGAIRQDVELMKQMGFNGARKHQKVEDPRFLYWCDRLGLIVWGEMANAYDFSEKYSRRFTKEWQEAMERDYNHPCIAVWVPLNESWGVPNIQVDERQQQHALAMYHLTKSLDPSRLVVSNDGWEMVKTDLFNIHDYEWRKEVLEDRYSTAEKATSGMPGNRRLNVEGYQYEGQPILVTEFGGIAYKKSDWEGWGYSGASTDEEFAERLTNVIQPLLHSGVVQGYCYTQLTDVEQEINGLLTYDRVPKLPLETIERIVKGLPEK